jgi:hypothetical protein
VSLAGCGSSPYLRLLVSRSLEAAFEIAPTVDRARAEGRTSEKPILQMPTARYVTANTKGLSTNEFPLNYSALGPQPARWL